MKHQVGLIILKFISRLYKNTQFYQICTLQNFGPVKIHHLHYFIYTNIDKNTYVTVFRKK